MLTALTRFSPSADSDDAIPFGYARKPVGFTLVLRPDGSGCQLIAHYDDKGKAPDGAIPNLARTVKAVAFLGCDNAAYVLGKGKPGEPAGKTDEKHGLFVDQIRLLVADSRTDASATAYLAWVDQGMPGLSQALDGLPGVAVRRIDMDPIAIRAEGQSTPIHESVAAQRFWADRARADKAGGEVALCLVCGQIKATVSTLPQSLVGHRVPGATQANVALASVNFAAASRGATGTGLKSAPICADCASGAVQNLNFLAASDKHSWRSPGGESAMVWWATDSEADLAVLSVLRAEPEVVAKLLAAPQSARGPAWDLDPNARFYALTFSGNVARFVVRRWMELPLQQVHLDVLRWFADVETPNPERPYHSVFRYAASLGVLRREQGSWKESSPVGAAEALLMAALAGERTPNHLLQLALTRASAEVRLTRADDPLTASIARRRMEARLGVIRLILNRRTNKEDDMSAHLDETREDPAYVSGRLFAVREALQRQALPGVNASIADKFYERASSHPASVEHTLDVLSRQHLRALGRDERATSARMAIEARIAQLGALRGDAPGRLDAEGQAAWICGYHQQVWHEIESARARKAARSAAGEPEPAPGAVSTSN